MPEKIQVAKVGATKYGPYIETPDGKRFYTGTAAPEVKGQVEALAGGDFVIVDWAVPKGGKYKIIQKLTIAPKGMPTEAAPKMGVIPKGSEKEPKGGASPQRPPTENDYILMQVCIKAAVEWAKHIASSPEGPRLTSTDVSQIADVLYKGSRKALGLEE